tara:strand:+ start:784 stop:1545 length:762 start_codon:yes stop_codon:yes gene_type:complete
MINLILTIIFKILSNLYSEIVSFYENLFLKHKTAIDKKIQEIGFKLFKIDKFNLKKISLKKTLKVNKYFKKIILSEKDIFFLINDIFYNQNLAKKITKFTGFNYNITFMLAYKTYSISRKDNKKLWHATIWHKDKPFSKNTLKLIIPINPLSKKDGGIEIYPKYLKNNNLNKKKYFKMITKKNEILIFHSNLCYHRAGNPDRNRIRSQIMFQLNPSANWSFCEDIWFKQKKLEPKFPLIYDLFTKKINIKTSK